MEEALWKRMSTYNPSNLGLNRLSAAHSSNVWTSTWEFRGKLRRLFAIIRLTRRSNAYKEVCQYTQGEVKTAMFLTSIS